MKLLTSALHDAKLSKLHGSLKWSDWNIWFSCTYISMFCLLLKKEEMNWIYLVKEKQMHRIISIGGNWRKPNFKEHK